MLFNVVVSMHGVAYFLNFGFDMDNYRAWPHISLTLISITQFTLFFLSIISDQLRWGERSANGSWNAQKKCMGQIQKRSR